MSKTLRVDPIHPQPEAVAHAVGLIRQGQVIVIPTDTVYGLAADPFQPAAVERIFAAKGRSPNAPVLLLVDSIKMATRLSKKPPTYFHPLMKQYWPGPLTIVVEASERIPEIVTAGTGHVGLRLPAAAVPQEIIRALGGPITGTSANWSGRPPCRSAAEAEAALGDAVSLILDGGPSPDAVPSTVVRLAGGSWEMIREGAIRRVDLESFFRSLDSEN